MNWKAPLALLIALILAILAISIGLRLAGW